jgi:hypothetical protein
MRFPRRALRGVDTGGRSRVSYPLERLLEHMPRGDRVRKMNGKAWPCSLKLLRKHSATLAGLVLSVTFLGCQPGPDGMMVRETIPRPRLRPIDANPAEAARLGQEVLEQIGYARLITLARKAGFVTTKKIVITHRNDGAMLATGEAAAASKFVEVFSRYAVTAGVTSQLDSPLPGPADAVAVGILVYGLVAAGLMAGELTGPHGDVASADPSITTAAPPAVTTPPGASTATAAPVPTAVPVPTVTAPPVAITQTCGTMYPNLRICSSLPREYTFPSHFEALREMQKSARNKNISLHNEDSTESGPCPGVGTHYNVRQGGKRAGSITCCPCCIDGPSSPKKIVLCRIHE